MTDKTTLREMADAARRFQLAESPLSEYAAGVEDVLRYLAGDAPATPEMREILPYALLGGE